MPTKAIFNFTYHVFRKCAARIDPCICADKGDLFRSCTYSAKARHALTPVYVSTKINRKQQFAADLKKLRAQTENSVCALFCVARYQLFSSSLL